MTRVLALHHPVANDLRGVLAIRTMSTDLERVADHATNIAEEVIFLAEARLVRHESKLSSG